MLSVVPGTLSGAFGWPPSSGDGAILESVRRRKIISGRRRRQRPPVRGRGSRNCAVPCTGSSSSLLEISAATLRLLQLLLFLSLSLSPSLYQIYTISTHRTLLLPTSTCYFTATSCCCWCCCCPRVFFTFQFRRFLLLELLRYEFAAVATTSQHSRKD